MSFFNGLNINASGLALNRLQMDVSSTNIANVNTNTTPEGGPYKAKTVQFSENLMAQQADLNDPSSSLNSPSYGVKVTGITANQNIKRTYDPTNPNADANGYVAQSNVNLADEMVKMIQAQRSYEANVSATEMNKSILQKALQISLNG
ncbi:flagellar basal body rod protein FlgC [Periweissella ghanensis]|uniref:Flagellar basal-body rod protein FlgC n=1 Tax=Periweissella ghanensis TaxID=467997 RepID=A0ABN8BJL8_9LACO|nr:flagellar basal body rod protein FlgC [Periweissella ghanensis]MCM0601039.1 flagellar basal body rod protein FlgC [Periweissella ghanensis]CAH0417880.1 Flagellar basal-body rod protein FlgC [Periweissella ghanensis]